MIELSNYNFPLSVITSTTIAVVKLRLENIKKRRFEYQQLVKVR